MWPHICVLIHRGCCVGKGLRRAAGRPRKEMQAPPLFLSLSFLSPKERDCSEDSAPGTDCRALGTSDGLEDSLGRSCAALRAWDGPTGTEWVRRPSITSLRLGRPCCHHCLKPRQLQGPWETLFTTCCMGYIFLLYFLNLLLLLFGYLRSTSVDICLGQIGYYPYCCPRRQRQPLFERMAYLFFVKTRCHFLKIKCKTDQLLSWALVYLSSFPSSSRQSHK